MRPLWATDATIMGPSYSLAPQPCPIKVIGP